jgi:outer membrane DcaP-like protein
MTPRREMALAMALGLAAASARAQGADPPPPSLSDLARLVAQQGRMLEEQKQEIERLRKQLEETQQLSLAAHNRLEEMAKAAPATTVSAAVEERLAKVEESVQRIPELPSDVVSAGEFPGSMRIPGTDVAMKVAGLVRATAVNTFGALGTEDRFVTSSIPVAGSPEAGKEPRFVLTPIPSRVNLDVRTPTGVGAMRAFVEGDFAGSSRVFRLRHAYGQWKGLIVGQTWSTFADPEAEPDGIDFEGLNAIALFRQPLVRWTKPVGAGFSLAAAIENPAPDITNAEGVSQVPDLVVRARWEPPEGQKGPLGLMKVRQGVHVNLALLFRQLRGEPLDQPNTTLSTGGFGAGVSGRLMTPWQADTGQITFSAYAGSGIGRYITDLGTLGGQDAYYDPETNTIDALPVFAWYLGYERRWDAKLRSTFTYGSVLVNNIAAQPGSAFHMTNRWSLNLTWSPIPRIDLVSEFLFGNRINKDGQKGGSSQLQLGTNFRF